MVEQPSEHGAAADRQRAEQQDEDDQQPGADAAGKLESAHGCRRPPFAAERRRGRLRSGGRNAAEVRDHRGIAANSMNYRGIHDVLSAHADNPAAWALTSIKAPSRN